MQKSPVRPPHSGKCPRAEEVENVDGMDVTVRADADDSEDGVVESQEVQGEAAEADQEDQGENVEAQAPRSAKAPHMPSQREIDDHNLVHCPYRAWCEACVRGQAKDDCHVTIKGPDAESSVTRVCMDYCFLTEQVKARDSEHVEEVKANVSMTILVMVETMCRSIWAYVVEHKGSDDWVAEQIVDDLETVGLANERIVIKADQETAITDLQRSVAKLRKGYGSALEQSRVGDSNSNGRVERAVQDLKGLVRTLKAALEINTKGKISLSDPIVPLLVRHAAHIINVSRVRDCGRTAWQLMKGRRSRTPLVPFGEVVMFKIPKTNRRIGSFEDKWEKGVWAGVESRSGEHLVGTAEGIFKVSTIKRRPADQRWSLEMIQSIAGSLQEPTPGSGQRRIQAYARIAPDEAPRSTTYAPAPDIEEPEVRAAQIRQDEVRAHGGTPGCLGCKAIVMGKGRNAHTFECRRRFEELLRQDAKSKLRFDRAAERRMDGITKRAMAMDPDAAASSNNAAGASGSGATAADRSSDISAQNSKSLEDGINASLKRKSEDSGDDGERATRSPAAATTTAPSPRGQKRDPEDDADDGERMDRGTVVKQGQKRKDAEQDDTARTEDRADDMSSLAQHPGPVHSGGRIDRADLSWRHIGSGVFARTFPRSRRLVTTTKGGPPIMDVRRRIIRSLTTGKVIDDCIIKETPDKLLNRRMKDADDIRVELVMEGALKAFEEVGTDVSEVYSQPRIAQEAALRTYGKTVLKPGWSLDLTLDDPLTGQPWDFNKKEVRARVRKLVEESKPFMLIGSPPCTMFSTLQNLSKAKRDEKEFNLKMEIARKHVRFCVELYKIQLKGKRHFLHEHPNGATSWMMDEVKELAEMPGVLTTVCDMCAYGLKTRDEKGEALVEKRTKFLTSSPEVCRRISSQCTNKVESGERSRVPTDEAAMPKLPGGVPDRYANITRNHRHANTLGGRARQCQVYSRKFCQAVCEGIAAQKRLGSLGMRSEDLMNVEEMKAAVAMASMEAEKGDPSRQLHEEEEEATWHDASSHMWFATDDVSGAPLNPKLVRNARQEEMKYFKEMGVYVKVPKQECWAQTAKNPIAVRWIDINKGDKENPNYRSRLVAKEFKTDINPELYAATPPSECLRMLISRMASQEGSEMMYADVSRAYFYAKAVRPVYVNLPDEDRTKGDEEMCGRLMMSMYGTRDAATNWAAEYTETLIKDGFRRGRSNTCLFHHPISGVAVMVHGDDFVAVGDKDGLKSIREALEGKYKLKVQTLGSRKECSKEIRVLNKIVRHTAKGIELEADPRHAEIVIRELGLSDGKPSKVPGKKEEGDNKHRLEDEPTKKHRQFIEAYHRVISIYANNECPLSEELQSEVDEMLEKAKKPVEESIEPAGNHEQDEGDGDNDMEMEADEAKRFRAITARLNYLAVDRVDLQYSVKEAARHMSAPRTSSWTLLTKIGRYLVGKPRLVMLFKWQSPTKKVTTFTDSDWAGCQRTAKSTSGGVVCIGEHVIKTYSRQQKVIALSSAEAELYAMVAASAESLAIIAYAEDLGAQMGGEVFVDSSAALGISQRCGIGKVRHLRTQGLWVQEARLTGRLAYRKVLGSKNPADVLTKHVPADLLQKHLETLCTEVRGGRAETAPELNSIESVVLEIDREDESGEWLGKPCKASCGCMGACDENASLKWDASGNVVRRWATAAREKRVSFAAKVQYVAIPSANRGRKCEGQARKKVEGRWKKPGTSAGGASPISPEDILSSRPRWADICEEEEQAEKNARAATASNASGEGENTVDHVEAEEANAKASEERVLRNRVGSDLYRHGQQVCIECSVQSANFGSTVDHFELSVEGGALGFRGLRGL